MTNSTDYSLLSLDCIIRETALSVYFQPIVNNQDGSIWGYEALIRGPLNSAFHSPLDLFAAAEQQGRLVELELLCRELSIRQFKQLDLPGKLFLNASPDTLFQPNFRAGKTVSLLKKIGLDPSRIVIELTEHSPLDNYEMIHEALTHYRQMGFEIAMDDLGSGYAGLRMWYELRPDYVKIDRHFISDIDSDKVKQHFVHSIKNIALELNCKVIAEGVETADELKVIETMGLPFSQGFYLARPTATPARQLQTAHFSEKNQQTQSANRLISSKTIATLLQRVNTIDSATTIDDCAELFNKNSDLESIPVVNGKQPLGLIHRKQLTNILFSPYGRALSGKKSIASLIDMQVLQFASDLPIEQASKQISGKAQNYKALEFIITDNGAYLGVGSVFDLLQTITNLQIDNARYANPLTLLPGNVPISRNLEQRLQRKSAFVVCYIDLDNFKPYNDCYGYEKGDQIITGLADILAETITANDDFIGHIGGDDFILILSPDNWQRQCEQILQLFSEWVRQRYRPEDQIMGGISGIDRNGQKQFYPLLSLSIGCVRLPPPYCKSSHEIAILATQAKSMAKKQQGNSLFLYDSQANANLFHAKAS